MPDNSIIIEELAKAINKGYEKQQERIGSLMDRLEKAQENGASQNVIDVIADEIDRLNQSIEAQNDNAESFYEEMVKIAGGRTDLDKEMLNDAYAFRRDYVRLTQELEKLISQRESEMNKRDGNGNPIAPNKDELRLNKKEQKRVKAERTRLRNELEKKYGKDSYAAQSAYKFISDASKRKELEEGIEQIQEGQVSNMVEIVKAQEINNKQLKEAAEHWQIFKNSATAVWGQIKEGGNYWLKYNAQAISDAKRLGMTSKEEAIGYMNTLMENSKTLARNFGMTAEQAMKMQDIYVKVTGRASMLTESQMEDIAAASKLMGEETVQSAIGIMDKMGSTSQTTMELMDKNFVRAANSGLDTVKASEEFVKNMSLANKLNFRNGVDGISKMTILSQRVKMNLQEVSAVADKFSTIEGAIEGAARLQMLGGVGAMYGSNPMQMMYEALADPESLFERMGKMFSQQAVFDRSTGESRIDPIQMQIIREQAKAIGMNPDEAIQSAKQQAKLNAIDSDFKRYASVTYTTATDEQKAAIQNKSEYDKENQTWIIKYLDDVGDEQVADIKNLTQKQLEAITKDNTEDIKDIRAHVRKIATELIGTKERRESMKDQWKTGVGQLIGPAMEKFDRFLTAVNESGFWKLLTGGGLVTALGLAGIGVYKLGSGYLKSAAINAVQKEILPRIAGKTAAHGGNIASGGRTVAEASRTARVGEETARLGSRFKNLRRLARARKAVHGLRAGVKASGRVAVPLAIVTEVGMAGWDFYQAGQERKSEEQMIQIREQSVNRLSGRKRFTAHEIEQQRIKADNVESESKGKAIGSGTGALAGMAVGGMVGGPLGAVIGLIVGGIAGGLAGGALAPEKGGDVIAQHLKDIEKGDEEDNFRKIVLPVESIDYNVSLIANQLGILSASPARGNIYLEAEAAGEVAVEGVPLQASTVNQVDTRVVNASDVYRPTGPLTLNINGSIDLNVKGTNVGKLTAADFKQMFDNNPELQRQIADIVTNRQVRNGNANRVNNESSDNRRGTGASMYLS